MTLLEFVRANHETDKAFDQVLALIAIVTCAEKVLETGTLNPAIRSGLTDAAREFKVRLIRLMKDDFRYI